MTAMTDEKRVSDGRLREIIAGTKGVTPGPWYWDEGGLRTEWSEAEHIIWPANAVPTSGLVSENLGALGEHSETNAVLNAAHIARLDPQIVTAICEELLARRSHQDGYRLVPVEPTGEMWLASRKVFETEAEKYRVANSTAMAMAIADRAPEKIYAAMIEASPKEGK